MNSARGSTPPNPTPDLLIRSTDSHKTLGIVGTPRLIKRNRRVSAKNTTNPRTTKTSKLSPFTHGFERGIKGKRTTRSSCIHPPPNPKEKGLKTATRNLPKKGLRKSPKGEIGKTHLSLEEPHRIIYTYQRGSYKV
jgi:hypothetical protein